jgi:hypothetical protein
MDHGRLDIVLLNKRLRVTVQILNKFMLLKNNSKNEWLNYNCGHCFVDIKANSVFEVDEQSANIILRNLGSPNWVIKYTEEKTGTGDNELDSQNDNTNSMLNDQPTVKFCEFCDSKGKRHKKNCLRSV